MDMKTVVIDSLEHISTSGNAGSTPELVAVSGDKPDQICEPMGALEQLLSSLSLDHETVDTLMNIGSDILTDGEVSGFRRGFRVATRLMMESLGTVAERKKEVDSPADQRQEFPGGYGAPDKKTCARHSLDIVALTYYVIGARVLQIRQF